MISSPAVPSRLRDLERAYFRESPARLQWALTILPAAALVAFYSVILRARVDLGHWPQRSGLLPGPGLNYAGDAEAILLYPVHASLAAFALAAFIFSPLVAVPVHAVALWNAKRRHAWRRPAMHAAFFVASWFVAMVLAKLDPAGALSWFVD